ncbi:pyrroline-5-carboxylate reductase [Solilutibacter silvestris]|uniref:Pyrroline-5-carboxylate reductase n=1 Tax=Solilutibacter silvestris TaxID=1645665 RepID=A0A2K1PXD4_9GAMM|nr:pyrroline-5-carboxylate reductase [Lysobacter silvestris]PNS07452.1 proC: pyrroline-5-carboxylate reductase [Lysobacter silvestris]
MPTLSLAFIGGGNMARSLIGGLIAQGRDPASIHVAEPMAELREALRRDFAVHVHESAEAAAKHAAIWMLAVKPQVMPEVCRDLATTASTRRPLVVSIAAGITSAQLTRWFGTALPIVRAMPNTPALLRAGITGLYANAEVTKEQHAQADALLRAAGPTIWLEDEALMDAVTAVSGSGPAYLFLLAEAMQAAGEAEGLSAGQASVLVAQTLFGAARMLDESRETAAELRQRVTSPKGTTEAAINTFEAGGFRALVKDAIHAARIRGAELSAANDEEPT